MEFNWTSIKSELKGFSGREISLRIPKTGLPFYDCLRLYGAIELYFGIREDIEIHDEGHQFSVMGFTRKPEGIADMEAAFIQLKKRAANNRDKAYIERLNDAILGKNQFPCGETIKKGDPLNNPDSSLQDGVRDNSAITYQGLASGTGLTVNLPLEDAVLCLAGEKRILSLARVLFLPVFEGKIDLSKIISPVRVSFYAPIITCVKALALLVLKSAFFHEGYSDRFSAIVFNTDIGKRAMNYSGMIALDSTAVARENGLSRASVAIAMEVFQKLLIKAIVKKGTEWTTTEMFTPTLNFANWILTPLPKFLDSVITTQEMLKKKFYGAETLFSNSNLVNDFFMVTHQKQLDHDAIRKFAKAVASAIYRARIEPKNPDKQLKAEEKGKIWYDEVVMLRSAPNSRDFLDRALILLEQGHQQNQSVGTHHWNEDFDPIALLQDLGEERGDSFIQFKQLFRMYLIQESTWRKEEETA